MPYALLQKPGTNLYWVITKGTNNKHSLHPLPKETAKAQLRALYVHGY